MAELPDNLQDMLSDLEDFQPTIPDELTSHYLERSGHTCKDPKLVRLVSAATECFIATVTNDTLEICKRRKKMQQKKQREEGYNPKDKRTVLTTEDLVEALQECGVNLKVPPYFAETKGPVAPK